MAINDTTTRRTDGVRPVGRASSAAGWVLLALAALAAFWEIRSPHIEAARMRAAALRGDAATVSSYVDYPALRASLKDGINRTIARHARSDEADAMGMALASTLTSRLVDASVSPEGLAAAMAGRSAGGPLARTWTGGRAVVVRDGPSRFRIEDPADPNAPRLVFVRHWPGWRLSGVEMPEGALP